MTNYIAGSFIVFNILWILFIVYGINKGWADNIYFKNKD